MCKMMDFKHSKDQTSKEKLKRSSWIYGTSLNYFNDLSSASRIQKPCKHKFNTYSLKKPKHDVMSVRHHGKVTLAKL